MPKSVSVLYRTVKKVYVKNRGLKKKKKKKKQSLQSVFSRDSNLVAWIERRGGAAREVNLDF